MIEIKAGLLGRPLFHEAFAKLCAIKLTSAQDALGLCRVRRVLRSEQEDYLRATRGLLEAHGQPDAAKKDTFHFSKEGREAVLRELQLLDEQPVALPLERKVALPTPLPDTVSFSADEWEVLGDLVVY